MLWAHEDCFSRLCKPEVSPDDPAEHGQVPGGALCLFCGKPLPHIGRHPYCIDVGEFSPPHRYWAHARCLHDSVAPPARARL